MTFASSEGRLGRGVAGIAFAIAPALGVEIQQLAVLLLCIGIAAAWAWAVGT
jgi:hypothetical protein